MSYKPKPPRKQNRNKKTETSLNRQQHPYSRQQLHIRHYTPYAYTPIRILPLHRTRLLPILHYTRTRTTRICHSLPHIPTITRSTLTYLLTCALYYTPDLHPRSVTLLLQPCHAYVTHGPALIPLSAHRLPIGPTIGPTDTGRGGAIISIMSIPPIISISIIKKNNLYCWRKVMCYIDLKTPAPEAPLSERTS